MLERGAQLPDLRAVTDKGHTIPLASMLGGGGLVLWFYPKDDTPG